MRKRMRGGDHQPSRPPQIAKQKSTLWSFREGWREAGHAWVLRSNEEVVGHHKPPAPPELLVGGLLGRDDRHARERRAQLDHHALGAVAAQHHRELVPPLVAQVAREHPRERRCLAPAPQRLSAPRAHRLASCLNPHLQVHIYLVRLEEGMSARQSGRMHPKAGCSTWPRSSA